MLKFFMILIFYTFSSFADVGDTMSTRGGVYQCVQIYEKHLAVFVNTFHPNDDIICVGVIDNMPFDIGDELEDYFNFIVEIGYLPFTMSSGYVREIKLYKPVLE